MCELKSNVKTFCGKVSELSTKSLKIKSVPTITVKSKKLYYVFSFWHLNQQNYSTLNFKKNLHTIMEIMCSMTRLCYFSIYSLGILKGIVNCILLLNHEIVGFGGLFWIFSNENRYIWLLLNLRLFNSYYFRKSWGKSCE